MTETHTYPDGSQRVGCPPFPTLSPMEQARGLQEPDKVPDNPEQSEPDKPRRGRPQKAKE